METKLESNGKVTDEPRRYSATDISILLDPTGEALPAHVSPAHRPANLVGKRVALLDISKPRGEIFLDRVEELLNQRGVTTTRFRKPTFAKPAPSSLIGDIVESSDLVVEALAD